jgi:hypothetical protein
VARIALAALLLIAGRKLMQIPVIVNTKSGRS